MGDAGVAGAGTGSPCHWGMLVQRPPSVRRHGLALAGLAPCLGLLSVGPASGRPPGPVDSEANPASAAATGNFASLKRKGGAPRSLPASLSESRPRPQCAHQAGGGSHWQAAASQPDEASLSLKPTTVAIEPHRHGDGHATLGSLQVECGAADWEGTVTAMDLSVG